MGREGGFESGFPAVRNAVWILVPCLWAVSRIHRYLLCMMNSYLFLMEMEGYFSVLGGIYCRVHPSHGSGWSLWGLRCGRFHRSRGCACLVCPLLSGTWGAEGPPLIRVEGIGKLGSGYQLAYSSLCGQQMATPEATWSFQLLWVGLLNFISAKLLVPVLTSPRVEISLP